MKKYALVSVALAIVWGCAASVQPQGAGLPEKIAVEGGMISGEAHGDVLAFKGIPYARAPAGDLRWKPPQPVDAWDGVRQCTEYGPICLQPDPLHNNYANKSEDCLYLNVWTAAKGTREKRPVMMWIHGGGNIIGAAQLSTHDGNDGEALAKQGVVVVSINYRLGVFGFFAHPLLSKESPHNASGNYGLLDQIAALTWIRKNIGAFGGDPGNVTIFGQSSGGFDVSLLIASPLAKGLFHRAITESSGPGAYASFANRHLREPWYGMEPLEKQGERVATDLGCADAADPLAALRALGGEKLLEGSNAVLFPPGFVEGSKARIFPPGNRFGPVVDGWVLPDDVMTILDEGKQNVVPLLAGTNADEMTMFVPKSPFESVEAYRGFLKESYGKFGDEVFAMYPAQEPSDILKAVRNAWADFRYVAPARSLVRAQSKAGGKAYFYQYTMTWPGPMAAMGAFHTAEILFVFNELERAKNNSKVPFEEKHQALADTMSAYWVQFAKTGNPNKEGLPDWPAYDLSKDQYLEFGEVVQAGKGLRKERLDLWDSFNTKRRKNR